MASEFAQVSRSSWRAHSRFVSWLTMSCLVLSCDSPWSLGGQRSPESQPAEQRHDDTNSPGEDDPPTDIEGAEPPLGEWFGLSPNEMRAKWNAWRGDPYALDDLERTLPEDTPVKCDRDGLMRYAGQTLKYAGGGVTIATAFEERLQRFEHIVADTATQIYGRAPKRVRHLGAFACRTSRNRPQRLSEHALGNALDVSGFDFPRKTKEQQVPPGLPKALNSAFQVSVAKHWEASSSDVTKLHASFLRRLIEQLTGRSDVFRGMVGPGQPGHADHFHFDMAPWHYTRL